MTLPVKSLIGLISSNSSRRPFPTNQSNDFSWSSIRFGISRTSGIRAYRTRCEVAETREDSATDSMNRSLTEERGKGRAHRRSRIPRFTQMSNWRAEANPDASPNPRLASRAARAALLYQTGLLDLDLCALSFEGGLDLRGLALVDPFLDGLRRAVDQVLARLEAQAGQLADDLDD